MSDLRQLAEAALHEAYMDNGETTARDALLAAIDGPRCATCCWVRVQSEVLTCGLADATDGIALADAPMVAQGYRQQPAWLVVLPTHGCREWSANEGATRREDV